MDPRHPELAISRMRELMAQYNRVESDMKKATASPQLAQLEREGSLVIQELCLVAPRLHEAMMQTSRMRRTDLARGVLLEPQDTAAEPPMEKQHSEGLAEIAKQTENISEQVSEIADIVTEEVKETAKKKPAKKKTTKKAKK